MKKGWKKMLWFIAFIILLWAGFRVFEWSSIYHPGHSLVGSPEDVYLAFEDVYFQTEDGKTLNGWWIPAENAPGSIVLCHGNGGTIADRLDLLHDLHRMGLNIFIFDYRGYGRSRGFPHEKGLYKDARAAFEYVRAQHDDAEHPPIIAYGRSLGGAVAARLTVEKPVAAVVLESTFTSVVDMGKRIYPWLPLQWLCKERYDTMGLIRDISVPILIAHGRHDSIVPYEFGLKLFESAGDPKTFIPLDGDHNDIPWQVTPSYWNALEQFLYEMLPVK